VICRFLNLFPIGFPKVFWISYCPGRCSDELLETVFERFVAPNSVVKRGFFAFGEYDPRGRMGNATFLELRALL
jgi:hypothetical protein